MSKRVYAKLETALQISMATVYGGVLVGAVLIIAHLLVKFA